MAGFVTNLTNFILIYIMYLCQSDMKDTRVSFDKRMFQQIGVFYGLGLPLVFQMVCDYWAWEQMTLVAGWIGIQE